MLMPCRQGQRPSTNKFDLTTPTSCRQSSDGMNVRPKNELLLDPRETLQARQKGSRAERAGTQTQRSCARNPRYVPKADATDARDLLREVLSKARRSGRRAARVVSLQKESARRQPTRLWPHGPRGHQRAGGEAGCGARLGRIPAGSGAWGQPPRPRRPAPPVPRHR